MKIAICGTHSTGKTSLLEAVSVPGHKKIHEIARELLTKPPTEMTIMEFFEFEKTLAKKQLEAEQGDFIIDRSIYDILAYSYYGLPKGLYAQIWDMFKDHRGYDLIFYLPIEIPLESDRIRSDDEEYRMWVDDTLSDLITQDKACKGKLWVLKGTLEERVKGFYKVLNSLI